MHFYRAGFSIMVMAVIGNLLMLHFVNHWYGLGGALRNLGGGISLVGCIFMSYLFGRCIYNAKPRITDLDPMYRFKDAVVIATSFEHYQTLRSHLISTLGDEKFGECVTFRIVPLNSLSWSISNVSSPEFIARVTFVITKYATEQNLPFYQIPTSDKQLQKV